MELSRAWELSDSSNFNNLFAVDFDMSSGEKKGGLRLLWKDFMNLVVLSASLHHIDALIGDGDLSEQWRFTIAYSWPELFVSSLVE